MIARDREFERQATREICDGVAVDVEQLIRLAERRADDGQSKYGCDFPDLARNLERETVDELLDGRNYLVWKLDAIRRELDTGRIDLLQLALKHVALAFAAVREAERSPHALD